MDENRFWILAAKKLSGEVSREQDAELNLLFISNPHFQEIYLKLQKTLLDNSVLNTQNNNNLLDTLRRKINAIDNAYPSKTDPVFAGIEKKSMSPISRSFKLMMAAAVLIFVFISASYFVFNTINTTSKNTVSLGNNISTKPGSKTQVKLPDGTMVVLNADSKLSYPDNFLGNTREVTLVGEAFFDVTHDKEKPFIIHSKTMDIKVLGTIFDVKAYPNDATTEASLIKGSIEVTIKNSTKQKIMLKPSEKIIVRNTILNDDKAETADQQNAEGSTPLITLQRIDFEKRDSSATDIAWIQNKLVFYNETLVNISLLLERRFGKKVVIKTASIKQLTFTGKFENETIDQILKALQLIHKFNYKIENESILIY